MYTLNVEKMENKKWEYITALAMELNSKKLNIKMVYKGAIRHRVRQKKERYSFSYLFICSNTLQMFISCTAYQQYSFSVVLQQMGNRQLKE